MNDTRRDSGATGELAQTVNSNGGTTYPFITACGTFIVKTNQCINEAFCYTQNHYVEITRNLFWMLYFQKKIPIFRFYDETMKKYYMTKYNLKNKLI